MDVKELVRDLPMIDLGLISKQLSSFAKNPNDEHLLELVISCKNLVFEQPEWGLLAGRIKLRWLYRQSFPKFSDMFRKYPNLFNDKCRAFVLDRAQDLDGYIVHSRDDNFQLVAVETFLESYLLKYRTKDKIHYFESPQYIYMREAVQMWFPDLTRIKKAYDDMSLGYYTHASPTMYNSCLNRNQLSSCFLATTEDDMDGIAGGWRISAEISRNSGGIGREYSSLRHSEIGNFGKSSGILPWLKVEEAIMSSVDQGGKRKGSETAYLCVWHVDIQEFIESRRPQGADEMRARKLFNGVLIHDLFMRRVEANSHWSLFCPNRAKGLVDSHGEKFEKLYEEYENKVNEDGSPFYEKRIQARDLWNLIITVQPETGGPFMLYKDAMNRCSNQQNMGTLRMSNLCTEIIQYCDKHEIASCNLATIALPKYVMPNGSFDFSRLGSITRRVVRNLNRVIDRNYYPEQVPQIKYSNMRQRAIGIGVQGLADTVAMMDLCWDDPKTRTLNMQIFETMYYHALHESMTIAKETKPYECFEGSPLSQGKFNFDMWNKDPFETEDTRIITADQWEDLRSDIKIYGVANSLLLAIPPTATTSYILGNNECIEAFCENIYARTLLPGYFIFFNKHMVKDFRKIGIWTPAVIKAIVEAEGSVQSLAPPARNPDEADAAYAKRLKRFEFLKRKYLTVFEIKQKVLADLMLDRQIFICQSQSFNVHMKNPTAKMLSSFHFYVWSKGAKTGMYYLRIKTQSAPINMSLISEEKAAAARQEPENQQSLASIDTAPTSEMALVKKNRYAKENFAKCDDLSCCT
jgi:ribonucleoside-diphosphate reductase alpha chain